MPPIALTADEKTVEDGTYDNEVPQDGLEGELDGTSFIWEMSCLLLACINSTLIPEAVSFALKLSWIILPFSILPFLINYIFLPQNYPARNRTIFILGCNIVVLAIAYFINRENWKKGLTTSDKLRDYISIRPDSIFPSVLLYLFGEVGIYARTFGLLHITTHLIPKVRIASPDPTIVFLVIAGFSLSVPFVGAQYFLPLASVEFPRFIPKTQLIFGLLLFSVVVTLPKALLRSKSLVWCLVGSCLVHSFFCMWSGSMINPDYLFSGLVSMYCHSVVVFNIVRRNSLYLSDQSPPPQKREVDYRMFKILVFTIFQSVDVLWFSRLLTRFSIDAMVRSSEVAEIYEEMAENAIIVAKLLPIFLAYSSGYLISKILERPIRKYWKNGWIIGNERLLTGGFKITDKLPPVPTVLAVAFPIYHLSKNILVLYCSIILLYAGMNSYMEASDQSDKES